MSKLIKNTAIYTIGRMLPQVTGFVLLPVYTKYLPPEEYGIVESMLIFGMVLTIFFSMASERSMFRLYYDYKTEYERRNFVGNIAVLILVFSSVILGITFLLRNQVVHIYSNIDFSPYFIYAIINAYFMAFAFIPQTLFQVQEKAVNFLLLSTSAFFVGVGFILYNVVVLNEGAAGLLKGKMIGNIVMAPFYVYIIVKYAHFNIKKSIIRNIFSFSLPMVPTLLTAWVMNMSNRIFIEQYFTLREVGIFSLAFKIGSVASVFLGALFTAYNPVFYRLANEINQKNAKKQLEQINKLILLFILIVCFSIAFFAKEFIQLFLDEKYVESAQIVPIIILSILINQVSGLFNLMIYQRKKTLTIMLISIVGAVLSIGFNFLFVPKYGIYGAAGAALITYLIIAVIKFIYAKKNYYIQMPLKFMIIGVFVGTGLITLDSLIEYPNVYLLISVKLILVIIVSSLFYKKYADQLKTLFA